MTSQHLGFAANREKSCLGNCKFKAVGEYEY